MTEKTTYVCDFCGEEFEDAEECRLHERAEEYKEFEKDVVFFDENREPIDGCPTDRDLEFCSAVWVNTEKALRYVNQLFEDSGCYGIPYFREEVPALYYYRNEEWAVLDEDFQKLLSLKNKFEKALDKRSQM